MTIFVDDLAAKADTDVELLEWGSPQKTPGVPLEIDGGRGSNAFRHSTGPRKSLLVDHDRFTIEVGANFVRGLDDDEFQRQRGE